MDKITFISLQDFFWIRFDEHQINFSFKGIPEDVHFTIAFNPNSEYVNLHLSRNVAGIALMDKPRYDLVSISKKDIKSFEEDAPLRFLRIMLEAFDLEKFKLQHGGNIGFLSYDNLRLESEGYSIVQTKLHEDFKKISRVKRKTRIKVEGDIGEILLDFSCSEEMQNYIQNHIEELPTSFSKPIEGCMLITNDGVVQLLREGDSWYRFREDISPKHLLEAFIEPETVKRLIFYSKRSIVRIRSAATKADTSKHNAPIYLHRIAKK